MEHKCPEGWVDVIDGWARGFVRRERAVSCPVINETSSTSQAKNWIQIKDWIDGWINERMDG